MNYFKIIIKFTLSLSVYLTVISSLYAESYPNTSIAVLDLNRVLIEAKAAKEAAEKIDEIAKKIEEELKITEEDLVKEQSKLIEAQTIMAPEAFESKRKEYEEKIQNFSVTRQQKLLSVERLIENSRNVILDNLKPILEDISDNKGITVLLEKSTVLLNAETMDITDLVIKSLNQELPKIEVSLEE
mgnify:CR=1 FL=1